MPAELAEVGHMVIRSSKTRGDNAARHDMTALPPLCPLSLPLRGSLFPALHRIRPADHRLK